MNTSIVSAEWLHNKLDHKNLVILDCTLKNQLLKQPVEIQNLRIKNARFFDVKHKFSDTKDEFPTAYPSALQFEHEAQELGINKDSIIVVYDANGIYSSPRVWWLFTSMGHQQVYVLDGGLPEWIKQQYHTEVKTPQALAKGNFKAHQNKDIVRKFNDMYNNVTTNKELVVDVRSKDRFDGKTAEPKEGLRSGRIPKSINIPYTLVLKDGKFQNPTYLKTLFEPLQNETQNLVFSCGSGITACVVYLASQSILTKPKAVYDGSWTEWGAKTTEDTFD